MPRNRPSGTPDNVDAKNLQRKLQLKAFWSKATEGGTIIVYPNETNEFPKIPKNLAPLTGGGEAVAMYTLGRTLERLDIPENDVRGTKSSEGVLNGPKCLVILLGSPKANPRVGEISEAPPNWKRRFKFDARDQSEEFFLLQITDTWMPSQERPYGDTPAHGTDFALITFIPGEDGRRSILEVGGLSTHGTQAAVEFICSGGGIEQIFHRIGATPGADWNPQPFEILLSVPVRGSALGARPTILASNPDPNASFSWTTK